MIPARKRSLTDSPVAIAYMIKGMLGGMMTPSPPATATIAVENPFVAQLHKKRNGHTSDSRNSCRRRAGNRSIEQAGDDNRTWDSCGSFSYKIHKNIKQFL